MFRIPIVTSSETFEVQSRIPEEKNKYNFVMMHGGFFYLFSNKYVFFYLNLRSDEHAE